MRRAKAFYILSLIFAGLGAAAWSHAVHGGDARAIFDASAPLLVAATAVILTMRTLRRERESVVRQIRQAASAFRPDDTRRTPPSVEPNALGAAVDGLIASSRAQSITMGMRIRELELQLQAMSMGQEAPTAGLATIAAIARELACAATPAAAGPNARQSGPSDDKPRPDRIKHDFFSMVSHELRTPLASIRAYTEMLIDGEAVDVRSQREFYDVIHNETCRLSQAIDNVVTLARLEAGLIEPRLTDISLAELVREAVVEVRPLAVAKRVSIEVTLEPSAHAVRADRDMLIRAVTNLLGNAVKYTPDDGRVTLRTLTDSASRKVLLRIDDTGVGIAPKDMPFVFDRFYGGDENEQRTGQGAGLGLALTRHVVEQVHGGRVHAQSTLGHGSSFGFDLELADADYEAEGHGFELVADDVADKRQEVMDARAK